jgi:hypothetical protein
MQTLRSDILSAKVHLRKKYSAYWPQIIGISPRALSRKRNYNCKFNYLISATRHQKKRDIDFTVIHFNSDVRNTEIAYERLEEMTGCITFIVILLRTNDQASV